MKYGTMFCGCCKVILMAAEAAESERQSVREWMCKVGGGEVELKM